jgi:hypothetical protein
MATGENVLWVVVRLGKRKGMWVFRTRTAARQFEAKRNKVNKTGLYFIPRATWGPEQ